MSSETQPSSRFSNMIAVLIALVSIVGALIAWRVAAASSRAGNADTDGLLAAVDREDAITKAYTLLYAHLGSYARSLRHEALSRTLGAVQSSTSDQNLKTSLAQQTTALDYAAASDRSFIPQQYLDRDRNFDQARDVGETLADEALRHDTYPDPHFQISDDNRAKAEWLMGALILLGMALVLLTLADALSHVLRYVLFITALMLFIVSSIAALLIEIFGAPLRL